ncbi:uncharacterized protein [Drosophila takahashii]|uniref:uncharacterized protein n=1 Tax=Drosophila takahashii TaxID=29030 RepID=UPI0007E80702|nr:uncharacterized protein LOC108069432 [Drosophila takahashii]
MSDKDKNDLPEQLDETSQNEDPNQDEPRLDESISASPSILRPINTPRPDISNAPSIVISLPETGMDNVAGETPEQRQRRRMRFLEMRREHYNHLHHSEQCNMSETEDEDHAETQPKTQEQNKPK